MRLSHFAVLLSSLSRLARLLRILLDAEMARIMSGPRHSDLIRSNM